MERASWVKYAGDRKGSELKDVRVVNNMHPVRDSEGCSSHGPCGARACSSHTWEVLSIFGLPLSSRRLKVSCRALARNVDDILCETHILRLRHEDLTTRLDAYLSFYLYSYSSLWCVSFRRIPGSHSRFFTGCSGTLSLVEQKVS